MTRCYKTLDNINCLERGILNLIRSIIMILMIMIFICYMKHRLSLC